MKKKNHYKEDKPKRDNHLKEKRTQKKEKNQKTRTEQNGKKIAKKSINRIFRIVFVLFLFFFSDNIRCSIFGVHSMIVHRFVKVISLFVLRQDNYSYNYSHVCNEQVCR